MNSADQIQPSGLRAARQAMLVIHGIGEQNPYETLDSFARGVFKHLTERRHSGATLRPIEFAHKDWTQVGMRIDILPHESEPLAHVDIFEYYWAPMTEDKLSAADTLKWVLKTDFTPLRYFADNLQQMMATPNASWLGALWQAAKLYLREIARVIFLYLPLAAAVGAVLWWLGKGHSWGKLLDPFKTDLWKFVSWGNGFAALFYLLFVLMAWFGLQSLNELRTNPGRSVETISDRTWFILNLVLLLAFLAAGLILDIRFHHHVVWDLLSFISQHRLWWPIGGAALATLLSYALTAYAADVAVYTNMDAKSKNFAARNAILSGSTAALKMLLACGDYDRVILAGHSLGSVIAYDTINELLAEYNATPAPGADKPEPIDLAQLQTLSGLLTFGSPLDKIYYFFREHVKRDQAIRAQILSMLHSFRKRRSGRDYGEFDFRYDFDQLDGLEWLNAWARMDPVSARLKFYDVDCQREFCYCTPVLAHLSYWRDPNFFDFFCEKLL